MFVHSTRISSLLLCANVFVGALPSSPDGLTVTTNTGTYVGTINNTVPNVRQFRNVPYAMPPIGSQRWLPPIKTTSDASTLFNATEFPLFCPQYLSGAANVYNQLLPGYLIPSGLDTAAPAAMPPTSGEDCLSLSIFTPVGEASNLPVIIFMTGGAYSIS